MSRANQTADDKRVRWNAMKAGRGKAAGTGGPRWALDEQGEPIIRDASRRRETRAFLLRKSRRDARHACRYARHEVRTKFRGSVPREAWVAALAAAPLRPLRKDEKRSA